MFSLVWMSFFMVADFMTLAVHAGLRVAEQQSLEIPEN